MAITRVGRVTKIYPGEGRVKVTFEDSGSSSLPLAMLTMNKEYSMPSVGDRVVTLHMDNGTSKGFVLGTYYGGGSQPRASSGYRKDFSSGVYAVCRGSSYTLKGGNVKIKGGGASVSLGSSASMVGSKATVGSGSTEEGDPETYFRASADKAEIKSASDVSVEAEGGQVELKSSTTVTVEGTGGVVQIKGTAGAGEIDVDTDTTIKATSVTIEASGDLTLKCGYGTITVEELMKRLERIEDQLGLPHTI